MTVKKTNKKITKKKIKKLNKKPEENQEKLRHVPRTNNYAELMRKTRGYHNYTFDLPRTQPKKKDLNRIKNSKTIRNLWESGQYTAEQIQKIIRRKAIDKNIDRILSPQQKTAITKQWYGTKHKTGLANAIKHIESGDAVFVPVVNIRAKHQYDRAKKTNKGIFIYKRNIKAKVVNSGQNEYIEIKNIPSTDELEERGQQQVTVQEIYFPFPRGIIIEDYVRMLYERYSAKYDVDGNEIQRENYPNTISIGLMGTTANASYGTPDKLFANNYQVDGTSTSYGLNDVVKDAKREGKTHPFSGVYFYWF